MKERLKNLPAEYGAIAVIVWFTIFVGTLCGFAAAISAGVDVEGVAGATGVWGAAYIATQLSKPLRIAGTVVATPIVAAAWHRTPWGRKRLAARKAAEALEAAKEAEAN